MQQVLPLALPVDADQKEHDDQNRQNDAEHHEPRCVHDRAEDPDRHAAHAGKHHPAHVSQDRARIIPCLFLLRERIIACDQKCAFSAGKHDAQNQKKQCGDDLCFHANFSHQRMRDLASFL